MNQRKANQLKNREEGKNNRLPYLPEHVIFEILVKIPSECLSEKFRYTCKSWYRLISRPEFKAKNKVHRDPEFLIQIPRTYRYETSSVAVDEKGLDFQLRKFSYPHVGWIHSSCNGLTLVDNYPQQIGVFSVRNFATGSVTNLPRCPSNCPHGRCSAALGYVPSSKEYKVVHLCAGGFGVSIFDIFTFFIDKETLSFRSPDNTWKTIPDAFILEQFRQNDPVLIGQVIHWYVDLDNLIVSIDISDERVNKTDLPFWGMEYHKSKLLGIGGKLSFINRYDKYTFDIWILINRNGQRSTASLQVP